MQNVQSVFLVLTSAIAIDGRVVRANTLVEVTQAEAKNLLQRGKARLATEDDGAPSDNDDADEAVDLTKLGKAELLLRATALQIEDADKMNKAELVAAIEAHQDAA